MSSTWSPEPSSSSPPSPITPHSHSDVPEDVAILDSSFMNVPSAWYHSSGIDKTSSPSVSWNIPDEKSGEGGPLFGLDDLLEQHAFEESPSMSAAASSDSSQSPVQPQIHTSLPSASFSMPTGTKPIPSPTSRSLQRESVATKQKVVYPPKESCINLPIVIPSIPDSGTKSRVETQIRVTLDLADAVPSAEDPQKYDRVGSWKWLKLPLGTATKKRTRKQGKIDASPEDTLYLTAVVTCATPPHTQVHSCSSCQTREAKRVAKKIASRIRPNKSDSDAEDQPKMSSPHEDTTSIIQFNCADSLEFSTGTVILPLRLTCYCRHHKEKVGFVVHFAFMDNLGRIVGTGSTRPIMITDDHKTPKSSTGSSAPSEIPTPNNAMDIEWSTTPTSAPSKRVLKEGSIKKRPKPYDGARQGNRLGREESVSSTNSPTSTHSPLPSTRASTPLQPPNMLIMDPLVFSTDFPNISSSAFAFPFFPPPPLAHPSIPLTASLPPPMIHRLIPPVGPTCGGTEVTILGSNFHPSLQLKCVFGDAVAENTTRWSDNTLVCVLPPRASAGVVGVWFQGVKDDGSAIAMGGLGIDGSSVPFTYSDESDRALMELALQIVGLKMTGKIEGAKDVAMRIMGGTGSGENNSNSGMTLGTNQLASSAELAQFHLRGIQPALLLRSENSDQLETLLVNFLSILDVNLDERAPKIPLSQAINHTNASGHSMVHLATSLGLERLLRFLITHGADLDVRDRNGWTPLHFCALTGGDKGVKLARVLLAAGADREIVDVGGKTAFEYASPADLVLLNNEDAVVEILPALDIADITDEEATWGDAEEESDHGSTTNKSRRRRKVPRRSGPSLHQSSSEDEKRQPIRADKTLKREKADEKQENATFLADLLQRTLTQLQNHTPQALTQIPMPHLAEKLPWNALPLPTMPMVFPVFVPMPGWPAFFSGEKDIGGEESPKVVALKASLRATWERWLVQTKQAEITPPPEYTPRAEPPLEARTSGDHSKASAKRVDYQPAEPVSSTEVEQYTYQPPPKEKIQKKHDRMLLFFWLPTLLLSLLWAFHTGFHFVHDAAKHIVASRTGAVLV